MTPQTPACPKNIDEINKLIKQHQLGPENGSYHRKLLMEGLENIRSRIEYNQKLAEAGNISLDVNNMGGWVHNLIRDTVGGKINCSNMTIEWIINGKKIEFNPYDGSVKYASES